jgi:hypothetical protein
MQTVEEIERHFRAVVGGAISLLPEGDGRYRIMTPFSFDDGDHLSIVLRREKEGWVISDEGHTFMHLSYSLDEKSYQTGTRQKIIENTVVLYGIDNRSGELVREFNGEGSGNALYDFIQALLKISDVTYLTRERVQSTFLEDFRELIVNTVSADRRAFEWFDEKRDPKGHYRADVYVNGSSSPLAIYALMSDNQVRDATIALLKFEFWNMGIRGVGVFEAQEEIARDVLARFTDVVDRQFSNLAENRDRIARYILAHLQSVRGG